VVRDTVVKTDTAVKNTVFKDTVAQGTSAKAIPAFKPGPRRLARAARAGRQYSPQRRSGAR
jgi:hypothetical protein